MYYVYILCNEDNDFYVGQTNNLTRRISEHSAARGAKFTIDNPNLVFVYHETFATRAESMHREKQLKKWTKAKKLALISGDIELLKQLSKGN